MRDWSHWKSWKAVPGEKGALDVMQFVKLLVGDYQRDLSALKKAYEEEKARNHKENAQNLQAIREKEKKAVEHIRNAAQHEMNGIRNAQKARTEDHNDLQNLVSATEDFSWFQALLVRLGSVFTAGSSAAVRSSIEEENRLFEDARKALQKWNDERSALMQMEIRHENAAADQKCQEENERYQKQQAEAEQRFRRDVEQLEHSYREALLSVITPAAEHDYRNRIMATVPAAENYACVNTLGDGIYMGEAALKLAKRSALDAEVRNMVLTALPGIVTDDGDALYVRMPYFQRLEDGVSLFLSYEGKEQQRPLQQQLRMLILRMFMSYPAAKVEVVRIDPMELGGTFTMFEQLGKEQQRITDSKTWSDEKEITDAITVLRQKMESIMAAYGENRESRLQREPIRILAITDFPRNFSEEALRNLQAIVRKAADCGVCVFIWARSEEVAKLVSGKQAIFSEIRRMLHVAEESNGVAMLETDFGEKIALRFDPMTDMAANSDKILATLVEGIHNAAPPKEHFMDMFEEDLNDPNNWFHENSIRELSIPIGIQGADSVVRYVVGKSGIAANVHHAMVAGQTGAGKSTLLHTIIMSTLLNYAPDEVQLYLADFKEGVEFKKYSKFNLPSIRVIAIDCEKEFGLSILNELHTEMSRRYDLFDSEADCSSFQTYREKTGKKLPRLLVIIDEIQELFRKGEEDEISTECAMILSRLLEKGRAAGIHLIMVSQNFDELSDVKTTMTTNSAIRIALMGADTNAQSVLGANNNGPLQLKQSAAGASIFNNDNGAQAANRVFRVALLEEDERRTLLEELSAIQNSEQFAERYPTKTRVLLTSAEDDMFNPFNQLILSGKAEQLMADPENYRLMIGEGFEMRRRFLVGITPEQGQNLMMVGSNEEAALSVFYFSILSLLYGELGNDGVEKDNQLVCLLDLSDEEKYQKAENTSFVHLAFCFPRQIKVAKVAQMEAMIDDVYETLMRRREGAEPATERLFLMLFGIDRMYLLAESGVYEDEEENSARFKLSEIIRCGAPYGITCIAWGETLDGIRQIVGKGMERDFRVRIALQADAETRANFLYDKKKVALKKTTAIFVDVMHDRNPTHFRPYVVPKKYWVARFAKAYAKYISKGGAQ